MNTKNLNKCIKLFDELTPTERLIVMDRTCRDCGATIEDLIICECQNMKVLTKPENVGTVLMYTFPTPGTSVGFGRSIVSLRGQDKIEGKDSKRFHELMNEIKYECLKMEVHFEARTYTNDY